MTSSGFGEMFTPNYCQADPVNGVFSTGSFAAVSQPTGQWNRKSRFDCARRQSARFLQMPIALTVAVEVGAGLRWEEWPRQTNVVNANVHSTKTKLCHEA